LSAAQRTTAPEPGRARRRQPRGEATRARIVEAVIACVDEGGLASATTQAIADRARVRRVALGVRQVG